MQRKKMVRISAEVRSGTARFRVGVRAQSIREALGVVEVVFPIEPEGFIVHGRPQMQAA
jgi:hypothetical protein